jgi:preprotein translocase subunit SecY
MSPEFWRRAAFTLGALLVFRIGSYIPLPGIDLDVWAQIFRGRGGLLGTFDVLSGGAVARLAVFALGITPYVTAAILFQFVGFFFRRFRALRDAGEAGRRKIDRYTIVITILMAAVQSYGIASALESINGLVANPGWLFRVSIIVTLTGGTIVLVFLADQITTRGIGNGIALMLCAGIVTQLPQTMLITLRYREVGLTTENGMMGLVAAAILFVAVVALIEGARREVTVAFSPREGSRYTSCLPFKLNGAGLVPAVVAPWLLGVLLIVLTYYDVDRWAPRGARWFDPGQPLYLLGYAVAIFFCVYLYSAFVLDPEQAAEKLKRHGGAIPQVEPGEATADYLDNVVSRVTLVGAVYLVLICLIGEVLLYRFDLPFYLGGTSVLILVCTVIDIEKQARGYRAHQRGG